MVAVAVNIVNVEVSPEMVLEGMSIDPQFAYGLWVQLLDGMIAGMTLDDAVDVLENRPPEWKEAAKVALTKFAEAL